MAAFTHKPVALVILDGLGYSKNSFGNAVEAAQKPTLDFLISHYPNVLLQASGTAVGLPAGFASNSEVGHETIGAGRIIKQPLTLINEAIATKQLEKNPTLVKNLKKLEHNQGTLHLLGLLSDGGVHSFQSHLYAYLEYLQHYNLKACYVHAFLDGRDVAPQSAHTYLEQLDAEIKKYPNVFLATIQGRFYAMDRDNNWQRTLQSYTALTQSQEIAFDSWQQALPFYYQQQIFDEFIPPTQLSSGKVIKENDGILFFNIRPDRSRQLIELFTCQQSPHRHSPYIPLTCFITPVPLTAEATDYLVEPILVTDTLMECLSKAKKHIFSIAETEKYAHISYFFNNRREQAWPYETRIVVQSLPARNYIQHPEMSAHEITKNILHALEKNDFDFYLINYANADMVGHSGDFKATVKAIECLDKQLAMLYDAIVEKNNGTLFVTSDHGNAEEKIDLETGLSQTSHSANPVYFIMANKDVKNKKLPCAMHSIADIAPCILETMHLEVPRQMKKI